MSKIINFNARDFHFDASCEHNVGSRMIQHNHLGQNETIFEIGDWRWNWTQIISSQHLEKNTDYLFRFAIELGINDTDDAVSQLYIIRDKNYEDRDVYPLQQSRFLPVLSKDGPNGLLRVFEIPFNSGDAEITDLVFVAQHAVTRVLPPHDLQEYDSLKDLSYNEWWEKRSSEISEKDTYPHLNKIDLTGANISEKMLNRLLVTGMHNIDLKGANIYRDFDEYEGDGDDEDFEEEEDDDFNAGGNTAAREHMQEIGRAAVKRALNSVKAQYDAAPDGSIQKNSLEFAMEQLENMLSSGQYAEEGAEGEEA